LTSHSATSATKPHTRCRPGIHFSKSDEFTPIHTYTFTPANHFSIPSHSLLPPSHLLLPKNVSQLYNPYTPNLPLILRLVT
jgi:hypothetical protein